MKRYFSIGWKIAVIVVTCIILSPTTQKFQLDELSISSITITPPTEYVLYDMSGEKSFPPTYWYFPDTSIGEFDQLLYDFGMKNTEVVTLHELAQSEPNVNGLVVEPSDTVIRSLESKVRSNLYTWLSLSPINYDQLSAYYFYGNSIDDWLGDESVTPKNVREIVDPLIYQIEDFLYLADIGQVRKQVENDKDFYNLLQRLMRVQTLVVTLRVTPQNVSETLKYWGTNDRQAEIRPYLQAMSLIDAKINVSDLLPSLPRGLLYRYQNERFMSPNQPFANCFWTALNFFNAIPDDRFIDGDLAIYELDNNYYLIDGAPQFGDVAVFTTEDMYVTHIAVYLVRNLFFTKNGSWQFAPWIIMPMNEMRSLYLGSADGGTVTYYRRSVS
jgi:hypothetical protein